MPLRTKLLLAAVAVVAVVAVAVVALVVVRPGGTPPQAGGTPSSTPQPGSADATARSPRQLGEDFLADHLDDGRVVRTDQGGDTVSEGQAYGMLVAAAIGDEEAFDDTWRWTQRELVRPDGLLAWRWEDGEVVDDMPASDADVDAARALVVAGEAFDRPEWTRDGVELGTAVLDEMTVETPLGRVLLPGPWAQGAGPWSYNPSYAAPAAFRQLGEASGDARWAELEAGSRAATTAILDGTALPSNWAQVTLDGAVVPLPSADGSSGTVAYSYDAARLPLRYAESCEPEDVALAARLADVLDRYDELPVQLDLGGQAVGEDQHPLAYVARAAAEASAGDADRARADLERADAVAQATPTYYGSAWVALAALQLDDDALGACSPLAVSE